VKDPTTFVDQYYVSFQETARKAIDRAFGVWKRKFLSVGNSIRLHYRNDIFFLVKATIVMHNMMVEARCENGELESEFYYEYSDCIDDTASANENTDTGNMQQVPVSYDSNNGCANVDKYAMAHWHWESLHSVEGAIKLHDEQSLEMMEHLTPQSYFMRDMILWHFDIHISLV
jgi:hypothetical protein